MKTVEVDHMDNIPRLNRIAGQIAGIKKMIEAKRSTEELIIQLKAVRSAIRAVEVEMMQTHVQTSLTHACADERGAQAPVKELVTFIGRLYE